MNMEKLYQQFFAPTEYRSYKIGDWFVVVQLDYNKYENDYDYTIIGPFATSEESVANGKLQTIGRTYIFQIRDTEPK